MSHYSNCGRSSLVLGLFALAAVSLTAIANRVEARPGSPIAPQSIRWVLQDDTFNGDKIDMVSVNDGWVLQQRSSAAYLYRWDGNRWAFFTSLSHTQDIVRSDIAMVSASDGWIVLGGPLSGSSNLAESTFYRWDGNNWNHFGTVTSANAVSLAALDMLSPTEGWAGGAFNFGAIYYRWDGTSWQKASEKFLWLDGGNGGDDIDMLSSVNGWTVGFNGIAHWNGADWANVASPVSRVLNTISMVSPNDGWIVGGGYTYDPNTGEITPEPGVILRWDGSTWGEVASPVTDRLLAIDMLAADDGWIVGESGTILHWDGNSWNEVPSPASQSSSDLLSIDMLEPTSGWITGDGGTLSYLLQPELTIDNNTGAPGSFFTLNGSDFPPDEVATVTVNGYELGTVQVGGDGTYSFVLSTTEADEGYYSLTASVNPSAAVQFVLDAKEPLWPQEGMGPVINVPAGIAHTELGFLPAILR